MPNPNEKVTTTSYWARLKRAGTATLTSIIVIFIAIGVLFWNEGRSVQTARALDEGAGLVVEISADRADPARNGDLVHVSGDLVLPGPLVDSMLGVESRDTAVRLVRDVEMYQWREIQTTTTETNTGGSETQRTAYRYETGWSSTAHDSSRFHNPTGHANPPMPIQGETFRHENGVIGVFTIETGEVSALGTTQPLPIDADQARAIGTRIAPERPVSVTGNAVYIGNDPNAPQIGDLRVSFGEAPVTTASAVGRQFASAIDAYTTSNRRTIMMVAEGRQTSAQMFDQAQSANTTTTWIVRIVGLVVLFGAFRGLFGVIATAADVLPFLGSLARGAISLVALALTLVAGGGTIALAWLWYRPLLSLAILGIAAVIGGALLWRARKTGPQAMPSPAHPG